MKCKIKTSRGFTLIELMIVVVIVGILAVITFPAYTEFVNKSRRSEAMTALSQIQQLQERFRSINTTYATLEQLGLQQNTPNGYYTLSITVNAPTGYTATATRSGLQIRDDRCITFVVTMNGGTVTYSATGTGAATCWNR